LLDGLTNPANVGMIIRTAAGAGLDAVVLPVAGSPEVGPLVVKASAGVALWAPIVRAPTAEEAAQRLSQAGVALVGLASGDHPPVWSAALPDRVALVLGNETSGISPAVSDLVASWCSIPTAAGVESLNVAAAAAVVCFELVRRRATFSA
jgi:23S rRNA (guanosine2251-2'-O)-methyltransferase